MKPIINIKRGKLIEPFFNGYVEHNFPGFDFPSDEEVVNKIKVFKEVWEEIGDTYLNFLYEETGLEFNRNMIDCFIVASTTRDMSAPLVIRSRYNRDEFIDVICHELIHILFGDNKSKKIYTDKGLSKTTVNHISVFALLKKFYLEVLNREELLGIATAKSSPENNVEYYEAWQIVEKDGYNEIIQELKKALQQD